MSSVMRLVWTYFSATLLVRALTLAGIVCVAFGILGYLIVPTALGATGSQLWLQSFVLGLPWLGFVFLLSASALMPGIVENFLTGRRIWILPQGRVRLLLSAVIPGIVLAALTALAATAAFLSFVAEEQTLRIFARTAIMAFVDVGLIYTAIWLVGKTSGLWRLAGTLWIIACVLIPLRYFGGIPPFSALEALGLASWGVFGAIVLSGGRLRHAFAVVRERAMLIAARFGGDVRYDAGREADLLLGTHQPWIMALGQIVPILAVAWLVSEAPIRIVFLVIFSAISGAIASQAARRSRALWLRYAMDRSEIAVFIERTYWRYNAKSLAVLLVAFLGLAAWLRFPPLIMALGCALVVVGGAVSMWLGLMITQGLRWFESIVCIVTMSILTVAALALMRSDVIVTVALLALLVALALVYRRLAAARWAQLDWMRAR